MEISRCWFHHVQQRSNVDAPVPPLISRIQSTRVDVTTTARLVCSYTFIVCHERPLPQGRFATLALNQTIATVKNRNAPASLYKYSRRKHLIGQTDPNLLLPPPRLCCCIIAHKKKRKRKFSTQPQDSHQNKPYARVRPVAHKYLPSNMLRKTAGVAPPPG